VIALWQRAGLTTIRPSGRDAPEAFAREIESGSATVLGAEDADGTLVGVVVATHDGRKGWINRLATDPDRRREGLGLKLVEAAERALDEQGIRVIAALVEDDNDASLAFFQAAGYTLHPGVQYLSKRAAPDA
jgi:ribosomal protein S18 acetylase RimI-like enzyme